MGIGFADRTYPHLLETKAADEKTSGYGGAVSERYLISEVMELPEQAEDQVYYQLLKNGWKNPCWEQIGGGRAGTPGVQGIH